MSKLLILLSFILSQSSNWFGKWPPDQYVKLQCAYLQSLYREPLIICLFRHNYYLHCPSAVVSSHLALTQSKLRIFWRVSETLLCSCLEFFGQATFLCQMKTLHVHQKFDVQAECLDLERYSFEDRCFWQNSTYYDCLFFDHTCSHFVAAWFLVKGMKLIAILHQV